MSDLQSVYDLVYDFDDQTFSVHDVVSDTYTSFGFQTVKTILAAHYPADRVETISHLLYTGKKVRLDPKNALAGVTPLVEPQPHEIIGRMMAASSIEEQLRMKPEQLDAFHAEMLGRIT